VIPAASWLNEMGSEFIVQVLKVFEEVFIVINLIVIE
jgi:hypothetical protein